MSTGIYGYTSGNIMGSSGSSVKSNWKYYGNEKFKFYNIGTQKSPDKFYGYSEPESEFVYILAIIVDKNVDIMSANNYIVSTFTDDIRTLNSIVVKREGRYKKIHIQYTKNTFSDWENDEKYWEDVCNQLLLRHKLEKINLID